MIARPGGHFLLQINKPWDDPLEAQAIAKQNGLIQILANVFASLRGNKALQRGNAVLQQ